MFRKKKKKEEVVQPEEVPEIEEPEEELPEPPKPPKKAKTKKLGESTLEVKGEFSLNSKEMALAVNALANSEEFKLYQQMVIGQQAADIIAAYNKAVGGESEVPPEDTDKEETLPE